MVAPTDRWGADAPVSKPEGLVRTALASLGEGWAFTSGGIAHDLTDADVEELFRPSYAPEEVGVAPETELRPRSAAATPVSPSPVVPEEGVDAIYDGWQYDQPRSYD